jgi:uncharacterized protein
MSTHDRLTAEEIIRLLDLAPLHTEGGYFRECYRSGVSLPPEALPAGYSGERSAGSAIYYLLTPDACSSIHRLRTDEIFHFYLGDPVEMLLLRPDGTGETILIGTDLADGMRPQIVVPGGVWQGSRLVKGGSFALMGTTVAPGFDPADFEAGERGVLLRAYPAFRESIEALSPGEGQRGREGS